MIYTILEEIDPENLFMFCNLYILQHEKLEPILTEREVKAFILMHLRLKLMSYEDIRSYIFKINYDGEFIPKSRPVHLGK